MIDLLAHRIARPSAADPAPPAQKAITGANPWAYGLQIESGDAPLRRDARGHRQFIREALGIYHTDRHIKRAEQVIAARVGGIPWHLEDEEQNEVTDEDASPQERMVRDLLEKPTGGKRVGAQPASRRELWTLTVRHAGLVNVAFWYLDEIDRLIGWPRRILYIRPDRMTPAIDGNGELAAWSLDQGADGKGTKLDLDEVLVFYVEPPDDGYYGHGLVQAAVNLARKTRLADTHEIDVLDAGGRLAGIVSPTADAAGVDPAVMDRLQLDLRNVVDMPDAAKRAIVARFPVDFTPTAADLQKLQTEELGRLTREEKFGLWGVNPTLAGFPAPAGLSSGDSRKFDEAATWQNACQPRGDMLRETIQYQLIDRLQKVGLNLSLVLDVPTFDDDTPRYENADKAKEQPLTQKERRAILNLPPFGDARDDEVWLGDKRIYPVPEQPEGEGPEAGPASGPAGEADVLGVLDDAGLEGAEPLDLEEEGKASLGPVQGSATGPRFIFGRLNQNWRTASAGDAGSADKVVDGLSAQLARQLGRKPTPAETQTAYRRQLLATVRGRMLKLLMDRDGGRVPSPEEFAGAMDKWREAHLLEQMGAVNKALGTTGSGYPGGGALPPRRAGWQRRLAAGLARAAKRVKPTAAAAGGRWTGRVAPDARAEFRDNDRTDPNRKRPGFTQAEDGSWVRSTFGKAGGVRSLADRTMARAQRRLREFLDGQLDDVVKRLETRAASVARKPGDASLWWDGDRWDRELGRVLEPIVEGLADLAEEAVATRLQPAPQKASADPYKRTLERLLRQSGSRIKGINETTRKEIAGVVRQGVKEGVDQAELGRRIRASTAFSDLRAETIARTETGTALNQAQVESYRSYGVERVQVLDGDGDAECAAANGSTWSLDEASSNPLGHPNCVRDFAPIVGAEA